MFVARMFPVAEEANGWQAFFLIFETFLAGLEPRDFADKALITAEDEIRSRSPIFPTANRRTGLS